MLKEDFTGTVRGMSIEEKVAVDSYFRQLDARGEFNPSLQGLKKDLDHHFLNVKKKSK